jgi:hypothetical protein
MKIMRRLLILFGISLLLFSCESFGKKPRAMNPNSLADRDPIAIGTAAMQFDKFFSTSLEKKDVEVWLDPRTDSVYLQFKYQTITFRQFWDKSNRLQFITALEKYKKDYEAKNLNLKKNRARRAYGILESRIVWGQIANDIFMNAEARPKMELGYAFRKDSPYFAIYQRSANNLLGLQGDGEEKESLVLNIYFTRAQADELVKLFDQQYLLSFLTAVPAPVPADPAPAQDTDYPEGNLRPPSPVESQEAEGE